MNVKWTKPNRLIVAAFDIGTTYSGFAYSVNSAPKKVIVNPTWIAGSRSLVSLKTPTCVLLDPDRKFHSFGFEAENKYAELAEEEQHESWSFYRRFKMALYSDKDLDVEKKVEDISGSRPFPLKSLMALSIKYLKDCLMSALKTRLPSVGEDQITFVLTVPAIWNDRAKQFMRQAAVQAGIANDQLILALESEVASVWWQSCSGEHFPCVENFPSFQLQTGDRYLVVDIGGGTADITVHEKELGDKLKEVFMATGGPWGGIEVDKRFKDLLVSIVTEEVFERFHRDYLADYLDIFREFETKKRTLKKENTKSIMVKVPVSLRDVFEEAGNKLQDIKNKFNGEVEWKRDKISINAKLIKPLFDQPINDLINHVKALGASNEDVKDVKHVVLLGGFAESEYVQNKFKVAYPDKTVIVPQESGLAILRGAVIYGHNPSIVSVRIARYTYGVSIVEEFDARRHPISKYVLTNNGAVCKDIFWKAITVGHEMPPGLTVTRTGKPASDHQPCVKSFIYKSPRSDVSYVTDKDSEQIGVVRMYIDMRKTAEQNAFDEVFCFGDTEIRYFMRHHATGIEKEVFMEF